MANSVQIQTLVDSERNLVVKLVGLLDTSNVSLATLIDPALLASVNSTGLNSQKPTKVAIKKVTYDVEDGLAVNLYWDATADVPIWRFVGRGFVMGEQVGFLQNNAGAGVNGKVLYDTDGYSSGSLSFSLLIECIKQWS
jgi:hypothetical protein